MSALCLFGHANWERSPYCGASCRGHCAPCAEEARRMSGLGCLALLAVSGVCWALVLAGLAGGKAAWTWLQGVL